MKTQISVLMMALLSVGMVACNDDSDKTAATTPPVVEETTPNSIELSSIGRYETGVFAEGAAEIPAYDAATKRGFIVNAKKGAVDVLDLSKPENPVHIGEITSRTLFAGSEINSVAVKNGIVAVAVQAAKKTDNGWVILYKANDLTKPLTTPIQIGALPDNGVFSPDGKTILVANEGEPNDDYSIDPEGTVSIIDLGDVNKPVLKTADFKAFNGK